MVNDEKDSMLGTFENQEISEYSLGEDAVTSMGVDWDFLTPFINWIAS